MSIYEKVLYIFSQTNLAPIFGTSIAILNVKPLLGLPFAGGGYT